MRTSEVIKDLYPFKIKLELIAKILSKFFGSGMVLLNANVTMQILSILAIFVKPCTGIIVLIKYYIIISTEVFSIPLFEYVKKKNKTNWTVLSLHKRQR